LPVNIAELSPSAACARVPGIQQCGRVTAFLAPSPRWEPYALTRSYGSVRGAISDGRPYRDHGYDDECTKRWRRDCCGHQTPVPRFHPVFRLLWVSLSRVWTAVEEGY
jgi:hypothetical protein